MKFLLHKLDKKKLKREELCQITNHKFRAMLYRYSKRKNFENISHSLLDLLEYYHLEILLLTKRFNWDEIFITQTR